jgi:hypothetical protein
VDTIVPSVHGETMKQTSTLSEEPGYTYDAAGRLTQVQEIPAGEGCTTRIYAYEENSNRTTLTSRAPGSEGKCASEGGSSEWHTYDTAGRLTDPNITYETFGNITSLPAADAGGSTITSSYYSDGQLYEQTQSEETSRYELDPEDRTRETLTSGKTASQAITHYDGQGTAPAWTSEEEGKTWTREIPGIDGSLAAIQTPTSVTLQLHDLQGNIIATIADSETETKLASKYNSTEFGVPQPGSTPPKYAWLGAGGITSEPSPTGRIVQDGITYIPQIGRTLQAPENLAPAIPTNTATPYTSPIITAVAAYAAATAAQQVANREQENNERAAAENPPGNIPSPETPEDESGGGGGGGGGLGDPLLPPLQPLTLHDVGCGVSATIHFGYDDVYAYGYFHCESRVTYFELKVCVEESAENLEGKTTVEVLKCEHHIFKDESHEKLEAEYVCGIEYEEKFRAWVWGRAWGIPLFSGLTFSEAGKSGWRAPAVYDC